MGPDTGGLVQGASSKYSLPGGSEQVTTGGWVGLGWERGGEARSETLLIDLKYYPGPHFDFVNARVGIWFRKALIFFNLSRDSVGTCE